MYTHLARDRRTTLQEADGMRSSEDDLSSLKEELTKARGVGVSMTDGERKGHTSECALTG